VTANDASRVYGDPEPTFSATITGFKNTDDASVITGVAVVATTATETTNIGTPAITVDVTGMSAANYTFNPVSGTLDITAATLTVNADNGTRIYGDVDPAFTASIDPAGFKNGEDETSAGIADLNTVVLSSDSLPGSNVGSDPTITITSLGTLSSANGNYTFVIGATGTLDINPAVLTVTADDGTRIYGDPDPAFTAMTATITGFKNGDTELSVVTGTPALTTDATPTSDVGLYTITAALGTLDAGPNYTFVLGRGGPGTLTIRASAEVDQIIAQVIQISMSASTATIVPGISVTNSGNQGMQD
jgi:hypothetical protein